MIAAWPWLAVAAMGAYHGLNPAMGWLFAVSLGLQERCRKKVIASLFPIAAGHLASIAMVVAMVAGGALTMSPRTLQLIGGGAVAIFGGFRLLSSRLHFRWVGMRVSYWELGLWSFLMASAHGAGLMLFPVLVNMPICGNAGVPGGRGADAAMIARTALWVVMLHTAAMIAVMAPVALVVYDKLGLGILRTAWINLDKLWALTLMGSGLIVLAIRP